MSSPTKRMCPISTSPPWKAAAGSPADREMLQSGEARLPLQEAATAGEPQEHPVPKPQCQNVPGLLGTAFSTSNYGYTVNDAWNNLNSNLKKQLLHHISFLPEVFGNLFPEVCVLKHMTGNEPFLTELTLRNLLLKVQREGAASQECCRKFKATLNPYQMLEYLLL